MTTHKRVPRCVRTAPEFIWLQISDDPAHLREPFPIDHEGITWCQDSVLACEVKYVKVDAAPAASEEPTPAASGLVELAAQYVARGPLHYRHDREMVAALAAEIERLLAWVNDLHSGMFINCVYCGHRYGPRGKVPPSMADVLKQHIELCPQHPLGAARAEIERLTRERDEHLRWRGILADKLGMTP